MLDLLLVPLAVQPVLALALWLVLKPVVELAVALALVPPLKLVSGQILALEQAQNLA